VTKTRKGTACQGVMETYAINGVLNIGVQKQYVLVFVQSDFESCVDILT
jgi:hypothetical protein